MKALVGLFIFLFVLVSAVGCDSPFPPQTLVERLRILGVRAEPPEVDITSQVELSALVADPQGEGRQLEYTWVICLFELGYAAADIPCPGPDSFYLPGNGETTQLNLPELVAWLSSFDFPVEDFQGIEITKLPLFVGLEVTANGSDEKVRGVKRITIGLNQDIANVNHNPTLLGVEVEDQVYGEDPLVVYTNQEVSLNPLIDESERETYVREGEEEQRTEDYLFSWYSSKGEFSDRRTIVDVDTKGRPLQVNKWTAPAEPGLVTLWVILRDGRFGTDWLEFEIEVLSSE
jgi:hypothetical protein